MNDSIKSTQYILAQLKKNHIVHTLNIFLLTVYATISWKSFKKIKKNKNKD